MKVKLKFAYISISIYLSIYLTICVCIHTHTHTHTHTHCFSGGSVVKNPPTNAGDLGSILSQEDHMKEEMTIHSSFLPRESHRQRRLVRSQKVRQDWAHTHTHKHTYAGFPNVWVGKESTCNKEIQVWSLDWKDPLWYSCLHNPMDRGAWRATSPKSHKE